MIVIADTTPINYLVLIEQADVLRELYGRVVIPQAVFTELQSTGTPDAVREWMAESPDWLEVQRVNLTPDAALTKLGASAKRLP